MFHQTLCFVSKYFNRIFEKNLLTLATNVYFFTGFCERTKCGTNCWCCFTINDTLTRIRSFSQKVKHWIFTKCLKFYRKNGLIICKVLVSAKAKEPIHKDFYDENLLLLLTADDCKIFQKVLEKQDCRRSQRDVVYLGWPAAPSFMSPKCGGGGLRFIRWVKLCTWSPNKL